MREELAGTTAICVILKDKKIYCVSERERKRDVKRDMIDCNVIIMKIKRATSVTRDRSRRCEARFSSSRSTTSQTTSWRRSESWRRAAGSSSTEWTATWRCRALSATSSSRRTRRSEPRSRSSPPCPTSRCAISPTTTSSSWSRATASGTCSATRRCSSSCAIALRRRSRLKLYDSLYSNLHL